MEPLKKYLTDWRTPLIVLFVLFWFGGVESYLVAGGPPPGFEWAGAVFLALGAVLVLIYSPPGYRLGLAACGLVGYGAEVLGVHTGFPFGGYHYTNAFAPLLFGVPLVLIAAWLVLSAYLHALLPDRWVRTLWGVTGASVGMVAIDLVLDPVAAGPMQLWVWDSPGRYFGIPATNFLGWFVTSLAVHSALVFLSIPPAPGRPIRRIGGSLVAFFTLVALGARLWIPAAIGAALVALHVGLVRRYHVPANEDIAHRD